MLLEKNFMKSENKLKSRKTKNPMGSKRIIPKYQYYFYFWIANIGQKYIPKYFCYSSFFFQLRSSVCTDSDLGTSYASSHAIDVGDG